MVLPAFGSPHVDRSSLHEIPALSEQVARRVAVAALLSIRRPDLDHQVWATGSSRASLSFGCNIFQPVLAREEGRSNRVASRIAFALWSACLPLNR